MNVPNTKHLKELEIENAKLKKLLPKSMLANEVMREVLQKSGKYTVATRTGVPYGRARFERTLVPAGHQRYDSGMIYLKLRQSGMVVNIICKNANRGVAAKINR